jgi:hypothetical protein
MKAPYNSLKPILSGEANVSQPISEVKRLFGGLIKHKNPNLNRNRTLKMLDARRRFHLYRPFGYMVVASYILAKNGWVRIN